MLDQVLLWISTNTELAAAFGTLAAAAFGGLAWFTGLFGRKTAPPQITINTPPPVERAPDPVIVQQQPNTVFLTIEKYEENLQIARDEVLAQIPDASGDQLQLLTNKRDEFESRLNNIEPAFEAAKARIAELESIIEREGNLLGAEELVEAEAALANGDFDAAEALLIRIEDQGELEVQRTARAAFGRGKVAEEQVRWHDAARHYEKAARLNPCFETLRQDWDFRWKLGNGAEALRIAGLLKAAAIEESGRESDTYAVALSCEAVSLQMLGRYAETEPVMREALEIGKATIGEMHPEYAKRLNNLAELLRAMGRYDEAEPLFRQAIEIDKATIGETHPNYAIRLNNLANLLRDMGRYDEAEPLYRQAIEIDKATIGETHPDYAIHLNNLAELLRNMGRYDEAEPLYRQAIEIDKATIGETHPAYAIRLNNLAGLLEDTGRLDEAEPLYRQAIKIDKATIGETHPEYAKHLNNLAGLLRDMGRFDEAKPNYSDSLSIFRTALGGDHPNTKQVAGNYAIFLRAHFPDDPALADLQAIFGEDVGLE